MAFNLAEKIGSTLTGKLWVDATHLADLKGQIAAIHRALAVIEFGLDGTIVTANDNFLNAMGYRLDEIRGKHHSMFVSAQDRGSDAYRQFWQKLGRGEFDQGQYPRIAKDGHTVWIQASYNPIFDAEGRAYKVVKYATDVTAQVVTAQQMQSAVAQAQEVTKAAAQGDLSRRVDTSNASGDVLAMGESSNMLLKTVADMFSEISGVVQAATEGNLTARVPTEGKSGDIAKIAQGVNQLLGGMSEIIVSVKAVAGEVLHGADEMQQGHVNLSQRTEQQASSLEETASSMEQMTATVKQNASNASDASGLANAARDEAQRGGAVVGEAVSAMAKINDASKKVVDIISVIDEIAFQTNLLALNAAVEAARAGEQGRGFAVVATEVRGLAGRSASAAKEIKTLIHDSVSKVEDGASLVTQSGKTLEQIIQSIKKVSNIVAEIATASREQSSGIEQVNKAVAQMDEVTQQNAALVEEATSASQLMADQARQLSKMMERYSTRGGESAAPPAIRTERRSAARPWREAAKPGSPAPATAEKAPSAPRAEKAAPPRRSATVSVGPDEEWREF
ncbi:MAG TPA: methyl-accepting chemotaxis protein [Steroidobacteraceae bacterium]|jgi:methyl-accepting chemotaxis protein